MDVAEKKMTTGESAREARRRKILDRGSDRLAFITGQIRSIPPPESSSAPPPPEQPPQQVPVDAGSNFTNSVKSESDDHMKFDQFSSRATPEVLSKSGVIPKHEIHNEVSVSNDSERNLAEPIVSYAKFSPDVLVDASTKSATTVNYIKWSPRQISSCIETTENARLLCALAVAVLVVLSYHGYGMGIQTAMTLIAFRPLFLVLLTDATIVLGMLLGNKVTVRNGQREQAIDGEFDLAKVLEVGLMLKKVIRATIVDCSVCALIMIVGIPFSAKGVA